MKKAAPHMRYLKQLYLFYILLRLFCLQLYYLLLELLPPPPPERELLDGEDERLDELPELYDPLLLEEELELGLE